MARNDAFPDDRSVQTDVIHARIHQGLMFSAQAFEQVVSNNDYLDVLILPSQGEPVSMHARANIRVGADAIAQIFRSQLPGDPAVPIARSADGTLIVSENRNQFSSIAASAVLYKNPTLDTPATPALEIDAGFTFFPGGVRQGSAGASGSIWEEWILRTDTEYLLRVTNIGLNNQPVQIEVDWYEPYQRVV